MNFKKSLTIQRRNETKNNTPLDIIYRQKQRYT